MKKLLKQLLIPLLFIPMISSAYIEAPKQNIKNATWLTFDACGGDFDWKMAKLLVDNKLKSSIFVTSIWIKKNPEAVQFLKSHPDIFKIENHGEHHHAAVLSEKPIFKVATVSTISGLDNEVFIAQKDIENNFGYQPHWFRGATALYDEKTVSWFKEHHIHLAGYTISIDEGATANEKKIIANFKKAKDGDILLMHINKPKSVNSLALEKSIIYLKKLHVDWS